MGSFHGHLQGWYLPLFISYASSFTVYILYQSVTLWVGQSEFLTSQALRLWGFFKFYFIFEFDNIRNPFFMWPLPNQKPIAWQLVLWISNLDNMMAQHLFNLTIFDYKVSGKTRIGSNKMLSMLAMKISKFVTIILAL